MRHPEDHQHDDPVAQARRMARDHGMVVIDRPARSGHTYHLFRLVGMRKVSVGTRTTPDALLRLVRQASGSH